MTAEKPPSNRLAEYVGALFGGTLAVTVVAYLASYHFVVHAIPAAGPKLAQGIQILAITGFWIAALVSANATANRHGRFSRGFGKTLALVGTIASLTAVAYLILIGQLLLSLDTAHTGRIVVGGLVATLLSLLYIRPRGGTDSSDTTGGDKTANVRPAVRDATPHPAIEVATAADSAKSTGRLSALRKLGIVLRAIIGNLSLTAILLAPGIVLNVLGEETASVVALFFGSFLLMVRSYRKPWLINAWTALLPAFCVCFCWGVQLYFFIDEAPSPWWLFGAGVIGWLLGWLRGRAHHLWFKDGGVYAKRTLGYLLLWAVAFGATQTLAFFSRDILAVRAGLITGAFSTALLAFATVILLRRRREVVNSALLSMIAGVVLLFPQELLAAFSIADEANCALQRPYSGESRLTLTANDDRQLLCSYDALTGALKEVRHLREGSLERVVEFKSRSRRVNGAPLPGFDGSVRYIADFVRGNNIYYFDHQADDGLSTIEPTRNNQIHGVHYRFSSVNGDSWTATPYVNGIPVQKSVSYAENGMICGEQNYTGDASHGKRHGVLHGLTKRGDCRNGSIQTIETYVDGVQHGFTTWYDDQGVSLRELYLDGVRIGGERRDKQCFELGNSSDAVVLGMSNDSVRDCACNQCSWQSRIPSIPDFEVFPTPPHLPFNRSLTNQYQDELKRQHQQRSEIIQRWRELDTEYRSQDTSDARKARLILSIREEQATLAELEKQIWLKIDGLYDLADTQFRDMSTATTVIPTRNPLSPEIVAQRRISTDLIVPDAIVAQLEAWFPNADIPGRLRALEDAIGGRGETISASPQEILETTTLVAAALAAVGFTASLIQAIAVAFAQSLSTSAQSLGQALSQATESVSEAYEDSLPTFTDPVDGESLRASGGRYWAARAGDEGRWLSLHEMQEYIDSEERAQQAFVADRNAWDHHIAASADWQRRSNASAQQKRLAQEQHIALQADAREHLERIRKIADKLGYENVLDNSLSSGVVDEQGQVDLEKLAQLDHDLHRRAKGQQIALHQSENPAPKDQLEGFSEQQRRDEALQQGIENALMNMPLGDQYEAIIAEMQDAYFAGDTERLQAIWRRVRGTRMQQLDILTDRAKRSSIVASGLGWAEYGAAKIRDISKVTLAAGFNAATGGAASFANAGALTIAGIGQVAISGIEKGMVAKNGAWAWDGKKAAGGAMRGSVDLLTSGLSKIPTADNVYKKMGIHTLKTSIGLVKDYSDEHQKTKDPNLAWANALSRQAFSQVESLLDSFFSDREQQRQTNRKTLPIDLQHYEEQRGALSELVEGALKKSAELNVKTIQAMTLEQKDYHTALAETLWAESESEFNNRVAGVLVDSAELEKEPAEQKSNPIAKVPAEERSPSSAKVVNREEYADYLRRRKSGPYSTIRPGGPEDLVPAEDVTPDTRGYTRRSEKHIQMTADEFGVKIYTRPTNPYAKDWLEGGKAVAKSQIVKNKTINELDTLIGAKKENLGLVAHFKPHPPNPDASEDDVYHRAMARYEQRLAEYNDQKSYLKKQSEFLEVRDGLIIDKKSGLPITGDVDGFVIRGMYNEALPKALIDEIQRKLEVDHANVRHGFHMDWDRSGDDTTKDPETNRSKAEVNEEIYQRILASHTEGNEALNVYTGKVGTGAPDPKASWFRKR